jgi:hypothetical protein
VPVLSPGRPGSRAEIRYSHASRNSRVGESCFMARASRKSSSSFSSIVDGGRPPRYWATRRRWSVRVLARLP